MDIDFLVIGGGLAGVSIAAELADHGRVTLAEAEPNLALHATGRSAALFLELYGGKEIRALTRASRAFFEQATPAGAEAPLLRPRGALYISRPDQTPDLEAFLGDKDAAGAGVVPISVPDMLKLIPLLRPDYLSAGAFYPAAADIDVDAVHAIYLRRARAAGVRVLTNAAPAAIHRRGDRWRARIGDCELDATVIVNAAGAWGDAVARMAAVPPVGLQALRRSVALVDLPAGIDAGEWPAVIDIGEAFYFKPDAGRLLLSPADEAPSAPCDAQPEEIDVAIAVDRVQQALDLEVRRVPHSWAGLRTFAPDRVPVVGFDPDAANFFWFVGQGGYGIQAAPALARLGAAAVLDRACPADIAAEGLKAADLSPARLRQLVEG